MDPLDHLIAEAARQMAQHEPSDALTGAVMARVAGGRTPLVQRRVAWASLAAAALAGMAMLIVANRTPPRADSKMEVLSVPQALGASEGELKGVVEPAQPRPTVSLAARRHEPMAVDEAVEIVDPILFEPIIQAPLVVDRVEVASTSIAPLEIAPIQIEPISTSDD